MQVKAKLTSGITSDTVLAPVTHITHTQCGELPAAHFKMPPIPQIALKPLLSVALATECLPPPSPPPLSSSVSPPFVWSSYFSRRVHAVKPVVWYCCFLWATPETTGCILRFFSETWTQEQLFFPPQISVKPIIYIISTFLALRWRSHSSLTRSNHCN